jgi:aminopeptidase N
MRKVLVACIVLLSGWGCSPVGAQDWTAPYRPAMMPGFVGDMLAYPDAPRYTIDMTLRMTGEEAHITGHQTVQYTNRNNLPLDRIVFRLYPNLRSFGGDMQVSGVTVGGVPVETDLDETRSILGVALPQPLVSGARAEVRLDYTITVVKDHAPLYGQFSYVNGVLALPEAYPVLSVYEAGQGWWQVTAHPQGDIVFSETAFYSVSVTAPPALILAASGSEVDLVANPDGTLTHRFVAPLMRDFALVASESYVTLTGEQDGVQITLYYDPNLPDAAASTRVGLAMAQNAVRIFNAAYGPYPFAELDVAQTPNSAGGLEYPGLFVVGSDVWDRNNDFFEFLIAHEAAHQWWYSLVGNDQALNPWMDEALAQYSVALYIRDLEGESAYDAAIESFRLQHATFAESHPDQVDMIGGPVSAYPGSAYFFCVYQKGPLFFAALDDTYGFDAVMRMLRDYFGAYRYGIAAPGDMLSSFEVTLGENLDGLFAAWISRDFPVG